MRPTAPLLKAGVSAAAALLLLTACGGSDDEQSDTASGSSSSATSSASSSAGSGSSSSTSDQDVQAFCTDAEAVFTKLSDGLDAAEPADLGPTLDEGVAAFDEIDPPAEISDDWTVLKQAFAGLRDAVVGSDITTPEGQAAVQQAVTDLDTQAGTAQDDLEAWVTANCDNA